MTTVLIRGVEAGVIQLTSPAQGVRVRVADATAASPSDDIVDLWGLQSFPASDPPANW